MRSSTLAALALAAWIIPAGAAAETPWLHVHVEERGEGAETVRVNVPLSLVETVLPLVHSHPLRDGMIRLDDVDLEEVDLRGVLEAVRGAEDGVFITVDSDDEHVRVAKEGGHLMVEAHETGDDDETVRVKVRLEILDALLDAPEGQLNVLAAVKALEGHEGDIVTVTGDDDHVRIWVDDRSESGGER
jgi:hypothetical protein